MFCDICPLEYECEKIKVASPFIPRDFCPLKEAAIEIAAKKFEEVLRKELAKSKEVKIL